VLQTRNEFNPWDLLFIHREATVSQQVGFATNPVWSPDGTRLAYLEHAQVSIPSGTSNIVVVDVPSWNFQRTSLPAGSIPLGWTTPPPQ
jgi:Tol biopolymer transport system component